MTTSPSSRARPQTIHGALAQQLQSSRCGPVIETVELPPLVEQSVELVSPGLRQRITLDLDRSLHDAGPLPVPRIMLQQVFQNLVQNAAEAARRADGHRGRLGISCVVEHGESGDEMLTLRFADDGVGIRDEDLTRIFEKGFSTSRETPTRGSACTGARTQSTRSVAASAQSARPLAARSST